MTKRFTVQASILALGAVFFVASVAEAQRPFGKRGRGHRGCKLMKAHPEMLKAKLGINDAQVQKIQKIWYNKASKGIKARAEVQQLRLKMRMLMQADLPNEAKVLALHRKIRTIRGRMAEEKIKGKLSVMRILTKEQRAKFRKICGHGMGHGKWGRGGHGKGGRGGKGGKGRMGRRGGGGF